MKNILALATASAFALAAISIPAAAETTDERMQKAPTKTMGDQGKLPATGKMGSQVPDMTGARTAASPATEPSGASGPKGPAKRMGDQGKLPATGNMSDHVPEMTKPASND
jgi:hypothetical protein